MDHHGSCVLPAPWTHMYAYTEKAPARTITAHINWKSLKSHAASQHAAAHVGRGATSGLGRTRRVVSPTAPSSGCMWMPALMPPDASKWPRSRQNPSQSSTSDPCCGESSNDRQKRQTRTTNSGSPPPSHCSEGQPPAPPRLFPSRR